MPATASRGGSWATSTCREPQPTEQALRRAVAYGTVLASFNVQEFGVERLATLSEEEVGERYEALRAMTHFEPPA